MAALRTIGWLLAIVYCTAPSLWLVVHPLSDFWRRRTHSPARLMGLIWVLMWVAVGAVTSPWRSVAWYTTWWAWIPAAPLFLIGAVLYAKGRYRFSLDQVLGRAELQPDRHEQRLVTTGIRGRLRHPYYLAHFCELLGWSIVTGLVVIWAMLAFAVATGLVMVRAEDRELEQRFGDEFRAYRERVPAFLPRIK